MKHRCRSIVVAAAVLLATACTADDVTTSDSSATPSSEAPVAPPTLSDAFLTVQNVLDGRTVLLSDGAQVRVAGLAAAEECWAGAATTFAKKFLQDKAVRISAVDRAIADASPLRLKDGTDYAEMAVRQGIMRTDSPDDRTLIDAEAEAAKSELGLWGAPCRGQAKNAPHGCDVRYRLTHQTANGFRAEVTISNTGLSPITAWTLRWTFAEGQVVAEARNAVVSQSGLRASAANVPESATIPVGRSQLVVLTGMQLSENPAPRSFTLNDQPCTVR